MSANTTAARSMVTSFLGQVFEQFFRKQSRVILGDLPTSQTSLMLDRIQAVSQSPGQIIILTGAFQVTIDIKIKERTLP